MKLEEQFYKVSFNENGLDVNGCVEIAENFAIGFCDWADVNANKYPRKTTTKELLGIYKKQL